jgi:hypothetical protein
MLIRRLEGLRGWAGLRLDGLRRMPGLRRLNSLRQDWPDALRMVISKVLAGTVSTLLHLPERYPRGADALDFLLATLGKDLHDLIRVLQGPRQE